MTHKSFARVVLSVVFVASTVSVLPTPASASFNAWFCDGGNAFYSGQAIKSPGSAATQDGGSCGTMKVRMLYELYPGSTRYYTGWASNSSYAAVSPGNTGIQGQHYASGYGIWGPVTNYLTAT